MKQPVKVFVRVKEFPQHNLPLLLSLPPHLPYTDTHGTGYNCNMLVIKNQEGFTRIYSMGMDVFNERDLASIFTFSA